MPKKEDVHFNYDAICLEKALFASFLTYISLFRILVAWGPEKLFWSFARCEM